MKKALISAIAIALFALPMSLQASPPKQDASKEKAAKPMTTMKTTPASPSQAPAKAGEQDKKEDASKDAGKKKDAAKK